MEAGQGPGVRVSHYDREKAMDGDPDAAGLPSVTVTSPELLAGLQELLAMEREETGFLVPPSGMLPIDEMMQLPRTSKVRVEAGGGTSS